jgi:threonylcarbamoyladenosine tRNA methylthiotransferase MtaB
VSKNSEVISFGCRLNIYESEIIKKNIKIAGLNNVVIFNTCGVTKEAEKQARQSIRRTKKNNPDLKIIVTGCAAQNKPEMFLKMPEVDKIIGNEEKLSPDYYRFDDNKVVVNDIMSIKETSPHLVSHFDGRTRAFIQVQNGCNHRCTFCVIPYGRGNSRSVPIGVIVEQIRILVEQNYNEVVFTGVDVTAYGPDLPGSPTFAQMIRRVLALVPQLKRLRLSSIDVAEIDDDLFNLMAYEPRLMPHFHISLQAGDNMILKRMKRRHNRDQIIDFCNKLRKIRPDVSFGADIIAGFPTETDEMFENTKNLISEAGLQYLHVFPYSAQEGTPAFKMPQVEKSVKKTRALILRSEGERELKKFLKAHLNKEVELLVEHNGSAHTKNFIPVKLDGDFSPGQLVKAELVAIDNNHMVARAI